MFRGFYMLINRLKWSLLFGQRGDATTGNRRRLFVRSFVRSTSIAFGHNRRSSLLLFRTVNYPTDRRLRPRVRGPLNFPPSARLARARMRSEVNEVTDSMPRLARANRAKLDWLKTASVIVIRLPITLSAVCVRTVDHTDSIITISYHSFERCQTKIPIGQRS